jgi:hypothetical protein
MDFTFSPGTTFTDFDVSIDWSASTSGSPVTAAATTSIGTWGEVYGDMYFRFEASEDTTFAITGDYFNQTGDDCADVQGWAEFEVYDPDDTSGNPIWGFTGDYDGTHTFEAGEYLIHIWSGAYFGFEGSGAAAQCARAGFDVSMSVVPLPAAAWLGFALLGALGAGRLVRRRFSRPSGTR